MSQNECREELFSYFEEIKDLKRFVKKCSLNKWHLPSRDAEGAYGQRHGSSESPCAAEKMISNTSVMMVMRWRKNDAQRSMNAPKRPGVCFSTRTPTDLRTYEPSGPVCVTDLCDSCGFEHILRFVLSFILEGKNISDHSYCMHM